MLKQSFVYSIALLFLFLSCRKQDVAIVQKDYKNLGTSAHDLLSSSNYTSLTIEVSYMAGYQPDASSLNNLTAFLNNYINKPGGITIVQKQIPASGKSIITLNELAALEKTTRTKFTNGSELAVHMLVVDADYEKDSVLGVSYWNTSTCLFGKSVNKSSGGLGQINRAQLYTILMDHEFGHLLGLVDQGTPMVQNHKDVAHGPHCLTRSCLMFYGIETGRMTTTTPPLDAACIADLRANGGK